MGRYAPQSRTCPAQPLSSGTANEPQTNASHVARRLVPWQSVPEPGVVQLEPC
jgi:hypothetical protein